MRDIHFSFEYSNHMDSVSFDNAFIYVGNYGDYYEYNGNGQLNKTQNDENKSTELQYDSNNNVSSVVQTVSGVTQTVADIEYDNNNHHNVEQVVNNAGTTINFEYNNNGQVIKQVSVGTDTDEGLISTEETTEYIQGGNYIATFTDANGGVTTYTYDNNNQALIGLVTSVTDPNGNVTNYTYDPNTDELLSVSGNADPSSPSVTTFTMQDYLPQTITRNGTTYSYVYDNQNRVTASKVGTQALMTTSYNSRQLISAQTYGNGATYVPRYDDRDRLVEERWKKTPTASGATITARYWYNKNGQTSQVWDGIQDVYYQYDYAFYGLLHKIRDNVNADVTEYDYDRAGNVSRLTFSRMDDIIYKAKYKLNKKGDPEDVIIETPGIETALHYNYDGLDRLTGQSCGPIITSLSYPELESTEGSSVKTSNLVQTYVNEDSNGKVLQQYGYTYDQNGNITGITEHELDPLTLATNTDSHSYAYDGLNRLASETDDTGTSVYSYDIGGNLTSIKKNGATVKSYSYVNSNWRDQLTAVDGKPITYDAGGNPLTYDGYTFTWQQGRQLAGFSGNGKNVSYGYDVFGNQTWEYFNNISISYTYSGNMLMSRIGYTGRLDFQYDSKGNAVAFKYNGTPYYYLRNQQGDVVAITDAEGTLVGSYSYDAWGNITSSSGAMASINPIRYRGYYQDPVTNWYRLGTRYYSPEWRRFVNADSLFIAGNDQLNGSNMYAYCNGNPVMHSDPSGMGIWSWLKDKVSKWASATYNKIRNNISQKISKIIGEEIMTPLADTFMKDISPRISLMMDTAYAGTDWQDRQYLFKDFSIFQLRRKFPRDMSALAGLGAAFLDFHRNYDWNSPNEGNYTTLPGSYQWQKFVGYNWWYDWFFSVGGPTKALKYPFVSNGSTYVVWCWKADYWNLGAGAEIGIYYQEDEGLANEGYYKIDTEHLKLRVLMNVVYYHYGSQFLSDHLTTDFEQTNWWVTSFTPRIKSANINYLDVNLKVAFVDNSTHPNLMIPFYYTSLNKKRNGYWGELSLVNEEQLCCDENGYEFYIDY